MKFGKFAYAFLGLIVGAGLFGGSGAIGAYNPQAPSIPASVQVYRQGAAIASGLLFGYIDVTWLGADPTGASDSSGAFAEAETLCRANGGGNITMPPGIYKAYLDLSGGNAARCRWNGTGAIWRPFSSGQTNSTLIYSNNCGIGWFDTGNKFTGIAFDGRVNGTGTGDVNYDIYMACSTVETDLTFLTWAKAAALYEFYGQYYRDQDSTFSGATTSIACPATAGPVSGCPWGAYLTGNSTTESSNEMSFLRTRFNSIFDGAFVASPASATSFDRVEFQAIPTCGVDLADDPTGAAPTGISFYAPYSENNGTTFCINGAQNILIDNPVFYGTGNAINSVVTSNLTVVNPFSAGPGYSINHPAGNADTAAVTWIGGNVAPVFSLLHPGPVQQNVIPGTYATASTGLSYGYGAQLHSGIVAPNGNIIGNVGDLYVDIAGGAGTTLYAKESGSGTNTGWAAK